MTSTIEDIREHATRWGWLRTIYHIIMRSAADYLGIHVCAVRTRAATEDPLLPCTLPSVVIRQIETGELFAASADPENEMDRDFVEEAVDRGDIAFGAFDKGRLIAYNWRTVSCAPHTDKLWVRVEPPYSYAYKSFTRPDYRGQRLLPSLILFGDAEMLKQGCTHRAGFIAITNFSSLKVGKHIDSKIIGYGAFAGYFGRCFSIRSKPVAEIGFEFFVPGREG